MSAALIWTFPPTFETSNCFGFSVSIREGNQISFTSQFGRSLIFQGSEGKKKKQNSCSSTSSYNRSQKKGRLHVASLTVVNPEGEIAISSKQKVHDAVMKQVALVEKQLKARNYNVATPEIVPPLTASLLREAYERCSKISAEYSKTFYLGTLLMTPEKQRALLAISVWCRRTDELVDGPIASQITPEALSRWEPEALSRWESRLEDIFQGYPYDLLDAALSDTVRRFPVHIQPFRDMVEGMRMDLWKCRYKNFDELYIYCYYVAGTVALMSLPVVGIAPSSKATLESVYKAALALGIANQLTNILRDVGEDARRGRVYLPQDELVQAGLSDKDIYAGKVTDEWRNFMRNQITRARMFYDDAAKGVAELDSASRWAVLASLILYRQILDEIEANDYDNFSRKACVTKPKKLLTLPFAYIKSVEYP